MTSSKTIALVFVAKEYRKPFCFFCCNKSLTKHCLIHMFNNPSLAQISHKYWLVCACNPLSTAVHDAKSVAKGFICFLVYTAVMFPLLS